MPEIFAKLVTGLKGIARGKAQENLGLQSPHLPSAMVRIARFSYSSFGLWILVSWYTAYANERVPESESWATKFVPPGAFTKPVISSPDRPDKSVSSVFSNAATSTSTGPLGPAGETVEGLIEDGAKALGIANVGTVPSKGRTLVALTPAQLGTPGTAMAGYLWSAPDNQKQKPPYNAQRYRELLNVAGKIARQYGLRITSGYRPQSGESLHASGLAFDMVGRENDMRRAATWASKNPGIFQEIFIHNEGSGLHLHLGFYPDAASIVNSKASVYAKATSSAPRISTT
jgi:hypothetical protein